MMCSCFRNITCCWGTAISNTSKQEEVAENERNHPFIISPPGYDNAAFEDIASTPVVSQPGHCDITIEAPPRQQCILLGSALPSITAASVAADVVVQESTLQSLDLENVVNVDDLTLKVEPSTSQSRNDDHQASNVDAQENMDGHQEGSNEQVVKDHNLPADENDDLNGPSTTQSTNDSETFNQEADTTEGVCDQERSEPFHWLPVCSIAESEASGIDSEVFEQVQNNLSETFEEISEAGSENVSISHNKHESPVPPVPNTLTSMPSDVIYESCAPLESSANANELCEQSQETVPNSDVQIPSIPSITCPNELSSSGVFYPQNVSDVPQDLDEQEPDARVSFITFLQDEDSVQYLSPRPQTGLSLESVDSAISMGSSPRNIDEDFNCSRSYSCMSQSANSLEVLNDSCDYIEESINFDGGGQRPRIVGCESVTTCMTDMDPENMSIITSLKINGPSGDYSSDGEVDISEGEVSISNEVKVTLNSVSHVEQHACLNDNTETLDNPTDETFTNQSGQYETVGDMSQPEDVFFFEHVDCDEFAVDDDPNVPCFGTENETICEVIKSHVCDVNYSETCDTEARLIRSSSLEENPAESISKLFSEYNPESESDDLTQENNITHDICQDLVTQKSPQKLKDLLIMKLVDIVGVTSHGIGNNSDCSTVDTSTIGLSFHNEIIKMISNKLNNLSCKDDLHSILTQVVHSKQCENTKCEEVSSEINQSLPTEELENALNSGDRTHIEDALRKLLKSGHAERLSDPLKDGCSIMSTAALQGHVIFFEILKENNVKFNVKDAHGYYPIHYAVKVGDSNLVDFLADQGQLDLLTSDKGDSVLHLAVYEGDQRLCRQLIEASKQSSISLDFANKDGMTPLHLAVLAGHVKIIRCLIFHEFNINLINSEGLSAVMLAIHKGQFEIAEILLSNGASPLTEDAKGNNILHYFVSSKSYFMLDVILAHYYPRDAIDNQNFGGHSALHIASKEGDEVAVLSLHNSGANIDLPDHDGRTALLHCATENRSGLLTTLVTLGANVHQNDVYGNSILHYVAKTGNGSMMDFFIHQCQVDPNSMNHSNQTALHIAAQCSHSDIVAVLLTTTINLDIPDSSGRTALHEACCQGNLTAVAQLVYAGAKIDPKDEDNMTPIVIAGLRRAVDVVQYLISKDNESRSLYELAKFSHTNDIHFLKNYNVDLDKQDRKGNTALHHAILDCNEQVAKLLLEAGVTASLLDNQSNSVLHLACKSSSVELIDLLIKSSCLIDSHNKLGETPAYIAAVEKRYHILTLLVRNGANLNTKLRDGRTLIFVAVENDDAELTRLLMSHGADVNYVCSGTMTRPIHVAAKLGHKEVMAILLKVVTDVDIPEFFSRKTPLHFAAEGGWREVVMQLLDVGADVNLETGCGEKSLHLAAREGHDHVVETLLKAGTQLSLLDDDGCPRYDLSKHRHVWAMIKAWALQHPSSVSGHRRLPAALLSLRSVLREAFRASRSHQNVLDVVPPYS